MNARGFERRYVFVGKLALKTGLHIGSGWTAGSPSNDPVIRTPDGRPFIPGSSFKGAFRSTVEKLAPTLGVDSCALLKSSGCVGVQGDAQDDFNARREREDWSDEELLDELEGPLCDTCKLFGSPYAASRIFFSDLYPPEDDAIADRMIQVRDGVAINRDSEKAEDHLKYDYEVVAAAQVFELKITLEDPTDLDLALTCMGLSEFVSGMAYLGGNRSRGLGNCKIEDLIVYRLDLTAVDNAERGEQLKRYLLGRTLEEKMDKVDKPEKFLDDQMMNLPALKEAANA
jgi:CRISPR-associated RAMP protein (TIGR02581 family)